MRERERDFKLKLNLLFILIHYIFLLEVIIEPEEGSGGQLTCKSVINETRLTRDGRRPKSTTRWLGETSRNAISAARDPVMGLIAP